MNARTEAQEERGRPFTVTGERWTTAKPNKLDRRRWLIRGAIAAALMLVILAALATVGGGGTQLASSTPPVIRPDDHPFKVRPENPGGMDVPNQDKLVFSVIRGGEGKEPVEKLLPPAEAPMALPTPKESEQTAASGDSEDMPQDDDVAPIPESKSVAAPVVTSKSVTAPIVTSRDAVTPPSKLAKREPSEVNTAQPARPATAPRANSSSSQVAMVVPPPAPAAVVSKPQPKPTQTPNARAEPPKVTPPAAAGGSGQVQLGALRSSEGALAQWKLLSSRHGDLLSGLTPQVVRVDLGPDKGVVYRLRAGPVSGGDAQAKALCNALVSRSVGCIVVRSGA